MKLNNVSFILLACIGFSLAAHANQVQLRSHEAINITYQVAHMNPDNQAVLGEPQSIEVNHQPVTIPVELDNYSLAGLVIVSVNGQELPSSANQFNQPKQCSMTTNNEKSNGLLEIKLSHRGAVSCRTSGGIFG